MKINRILVFQHLRIEHPGIFRDFFKEDNVESTIIELDEGEQIPDLKDYDALWVMGGPMDVWEEAEYPWLIDEKAAIRKAVNELKMPYVGICLGHQLLADALGAEVKSAPPGMDILSYSDKCAIQSLSLGVQVFTMQYHQEIIASTVSDWSAILAYNDALEKSLGENAVNKLEQETLENMTYFNKTARKIYENWKLAVLNYSCHE